MMQTRVKFGNDSSSNSSTVLTCSMLDQASPIQAQIESSMKFESNESSIQAQASRSLS